MTAFFNLLLALVIIMNVLPVIPVFLNLTEDLTIDERRATTKDALVAGSSVAVVMILAGPWIFKGMGITLNDLRMGGGLVLLVFAIHDLLFSVERRRSTRGQRLGVVPLGIPLMVGPAGLTALLVYSDRFGMLQVLLALAVVMVLNGTLLYFAGRLVRIFGSPALRVMGKVMSLLIAALAVSMIRTGIQQVVTAS